MRGPFALSDPDVIRSVLASEVAIDGVLAPMWFGADADDASRLMLGLLGWMLDGADDDARAHACDALRSTMSAHETAAGVTYDSAAWVITATHP